MRYEKTSDSPRNASNDGSVIVMPYGHHETKKSENKERNKQKIKIPKDTTKEYLEEDLNPEIKELNEKARSMISTVPSYIDNSSRKSARAGSIEQRISTDGDAYQKISEELSSLREKLASYLQENYRDTEITERERTITKGIAGNSLINWIRKLFGLPETEKQVEQLVLEKVEVDVPQYAGTPGDLQQLINDSATTLLNYNKEISITVGDIDAVTSEMRGLQKDYLTRLISEKKSFNQTRKNIDESKKLIGELKERLEDMSLTENGFELTLNNYEELENFVLQAKYRQKEQHINTVLFVNQKNALRVYEKCLDFAKYTTVQMMHYVDNFANIVLQLNICVDNVDKVCQYLAKTTDIGQRTMGLMNEGQKYLAGLLNCTKSIYENPPTNIVSMENFENGITEASSKLEEELRLAEEEQKKLDCMIKPYSTTTKPRGRTG